MSQEFVSDDEANNPVMVYLREAAAIEPLSKAQEIALSKQIAQNPADEASKRRLIEAHLRLVVEIAKEYKVQDVSLLDLIQNGNIGLMHAVEEFDYRVHDSFAICAVPLIRQSIEGSLSGE